MINADELLLVVDENNNPIEPKPRAEVHQKGYWHRTSHIWVVTPQKQILCQRRSLKKDTNPGLWESFFGGHLAPGTEYDDGAITELHEELGIQATKKDLQLFTVYKYQPGHEFQAVFTYPWSGAVPDIRFEQEEIDEVRLFDIESLFDVLVIHPSDNWSQMGYERDLLTHLKGV